MAIVNFINTKAKSNHILKKIINYVTQEEKTDEKLISGKDLMPESAYSEMILTKKEFNKTGGRQYLHMVQSFSPKENIDHEKAHEIALELAQYFEKFQVLVATHKDKNHVHSHFIINSVNFETGLKIQQSFNQLKEVMDKSDEICKQNGFSVLRERKFGNHISRNEYHAALKGESWKMRLIAHVRDAISCTSSKEDFIIYMNSRGYEVNWKDSRKYITYTTPEGNKCRCKGLHDEKYTKEGMENVFNARQFGRQKQRTIESRASSNGLHDQSKGLDRNDGYTDGTSHSEFRGACRHDGKVPEGTDAEKPKPSRRIGKSSEEKFGRDESGHGSEHEGGREQVSSSKFRQRSDSKEASNDDTSFEGDGWNANSVVDIGYSFSSLIAEREDADVRVRAHRHTGDLTKEGRKERALKDHNVWDEER